MEGLPPKTNCEEDKNRSVRFAGESNSPALNDVVLSNIRALKSTCVVTYVLSLKQQFNCVV